MTDMPERIWCWKEPREVFWVGSDESTTLDYTDVGEYIRADTLPQQSLCLPAHDRPLVDGVYKFVGKWEIFWPDGNDKHEGECIVFARSHEDIDIQADVYVEDEMMDRWAGVFYGPIPLTLMVQAEGE